MGGGGDVEEVSNRLMIPVELLQMTEAFQVHDEGIYPDNAKTVAVFLDVLTQWIVGPGGPIGLNYVALQTLPAIRRIKDDDEYEDIFNGLQVMERAVLQHFREQKDV